jgi:hypothetical protein
MWVRMHVRGMPGFMRWPPRQVWQLCPAFQIFGVVGGQGRAGFCLEHYLVDSLPPNNALVRLPTARHDNRTAAYHDDILIDGNRQ